MARQEYNGWYNYETWLANLWFDGAFGEDAERCVEDADGDMDAATDALAIVIRETIEIHIEATTGKSGFVDDIVNAALREINYEEIARHYIDEVEIELTEEVEEAVDE